MVNEGDQPKGESVIRRADMSPCGRYRYRLSRYWGRGPMLPFVMLNPSTADAEVDDPTILRCMGFGRREGGGGIVVANLFAFRAPSPVALTKATDPIGLDNDDALIELAADSRGNAIPIICAWGARGGVAADRASQMLRDAGARLVCLGKTRDGHPRHPLYVRADQALEPFP
jgi:hypothetical protein